MKLIKIPLALGAIICCYFLYRISKFVLLNDMPMTVLFGAAGFAAILIFTSCVIAEIWTEINKSEDNT